MQNGSSDGCAEEPSSCTTDGPAYHEATGNPAHSAGANACYGEQEGSEGFVELETLDVVKWELLEALVMLARLPRLSSHCSGNGTVRPADHAAEKRHLGVTCCFR